VTWVPALLLLVVQILFAGNFTFLIANLYLFPAITLFSFYGVLRAVTGSTQLSWLSVPNSLDQLGNAIFRLPARYDTPLAISALTVLVVVAASGVILERRVRGIEVVA
jgi:hypothetical protein